MTIVDVQYRLTGNLIPVDHGYHLLSAISCLIPGLHGDDEVGVHPITGRLVGNRCLALTASSSLTIRLSANRISEILPLAGKRLPIDEHEVLVGVPSIRALAPRARLYSRLVVIKGFMEPEEFLGAARRQLDSLGINGIPALLARREEKSLEGRVGRDPERCPFVRRTLRIRDKEVVGYAIQVSGLSAEDSIKLQEHGIGGRRRFGCGVFVGRKG